MIEFLSEHDLKFAFEMRKRMTSANSDNKRSVEKLALEFGIEDKTRVKELIEFAIVQMARAYASQNQLTVYERYQKIVELYKNQVNLSHRTSQSILLQQYSTPAPISYLAGKFCLKTLYTKIENKKIHFPQSYQYNAYEPSAGTGLLTDRKSTRLNSSH